MIDSHLPRFSQGLQAILLASAYLFDVRWVVPLLGVILLAAVLGGPRWNVLAYLYKALPIPRGEPEPAAPPRFAQTLGVIFLTIGTIGLYASEPDSTAYFWLGWAPALMVVILAAIAATTAF